MPVVKRPPFPVGSGEPVEGWARSSEFADTDKQHRRNGGDEKCKKDGEKLNLRNATWMNACYAQQVTGHAGHPEALILTYICNGLKHDNSGRESVVTTQLGKDRKVSRAFPAPPKCCSNVMSALTLANNFHGCDAESSISILAF